MKLRLPKKALLLFFLLTSCTIAFGQIPVDCPDSIPNENTAILLPPGNGFLGIDEAIGTADNTNGSDCALAIVNNDPNELFANYRIPIDLVAYGITSGDELFISLDGNSSEGVARIEVLRDNTPNNAIFSHTYLGGWSTISETIVVPNGIETLDIWLYSNYLSNEPGTAYYDNLIVRKEIGLVPGAFVTTWKTDNPGISEDNQITIPTFPGEIYDYSVDWGDGSTSENVTEDITHTYPSAGTYTISITGDFPRIYFNNVVLGIPTQGDEEKILSVDQWGSTVWTSMLGAFAGCKNLDVLATDVPDLSSVSDMTGMFRYCESLIGNSSFNSWNVNNITQMGSLFEGAIKFNQNIGSWNVDNVTFMSDLFNNATSFNQDISSWNVGNVKQMVLTFGSASSFNQNIGNWNVSKVEDMLGMFAGATSFNQDIGNWNLENSTRTQAMFSGATSFNQDLSDWNVGKVTSFNVMFFGATAFDQDLSSWDIKLVSNMDEMFTDSGLSDTNYDNILIGWSQLPNLQDEVPFGAGSAQFCLGEDARQILVDNFGWTINDGGKAADCQSPFITTWKTDNLGVSENNQIMIPTFPGEIYDYSVDWGDGIVENINSDTSPTHTYANPGQYTVKILGEFPRIFFNFNGDSKKIIEVNQWGDIEWSSMGFAFSGCENLDVTAVDMPILASVNSLQNMFTSCFLLRGNNSFNNWNVSNVTTMSAMFFEARLFNENIGAWNTSNLVDASGMFAGAISFDQPIGQWDVSNVEGLNGMFNGAINFNQDITGWDVSSVISLSNTFARTKKFNQDLKNWDVSNVILMSGMFEESELFDQNLGNWNISNLLDATNMFKNSSLSTENYDRTLIGWSQLPLLQNDVQFDAPQNQFCEARVARLKIINKYGWVINDAGRSDNCDFEERPFVTRWKTDNPGTSEDNQITIPTFPQINYDYSVDWGDGNTSENVTTSISHTYETPGEYTVSITGLFPQIYFFQSGEEQKIISVDQWGSIAWNSMNSAFSGCSNLDVVANDAPDLTNVTDLAGMFVPYR